MKWILALDEECGPTLPLVTYKSGRPLVSVPSWANSLEDVHFNQDYHSIRHMSQFLVPDLYSNTIQSNKSSSSSSDSNTHRVDSSVTSGWASSLLLESFFNSQTGVVTVIAMNKDHDNEVQLGLQQGEGVVLWDTLPVYSTKVYQWSTY